MLDKETMIQNARVAVKVLNEALEADRVAIETLVDKRVSVNDKLAAHPTIQVMNVDGNLLLGMLGIINGIIGADEDGWGFIAAVYNEQTELLRFEVIPDNPNIRKS